MTPKQVAGIKKAMRRHAHRLNIERYTDDLIGYALESFFKNPKRKSAHVAVDFMRSHFGRPGSKKSSVEANLCSLETVAKVTTPMPSLPPLEIWTEALAPLKRDERVAFFLYHHFQLTPSEVGNVLGVTESRVSQLLSQASNALQGLENEDPVKSSTPAPVVNNEQEKMTLTWQTGTTFEEIEKQVMIMTYKAMRKNKAATARALGMADKTVRVKLKIWKVK